MKVFGLHRRKVNYVALLAAPESAYTGALKVLEGDFKLRISLGVLRKGGAYGRSEQLWAKWETMLVSYRDPAMRQPGL